MESNVNRCLWALWACVLFFLAGCQGFNTATDESYDKQAASRGTGPDDDGDGYGAVIDCDDTDEDVNPGANEDPSNEIDDDCDGATDCDDNSADLTESCYDGDDDGDCADTNGDGEIDVVFLCNVDNDENAATIAAQTGGDADLIQNYIEVEYEGDSVSGYTLPDPDCNDDNADVNPSASEVCNGVDDDCNDQVDDGVSTPTAFYADADEDGFGDADSSVTECEMPSGYVSDWTDCDDTNAAINPDAIEVCDDGDVDEDCDGSDDGSDAIGMTDWYLDADDDSYGDVYVSTSCDNPSSEVLVDNSDDCDDDNADVNPEAIEVCNGFDDDCDDMIDDEDDSTDESTMTDWYVDSDVDGYGSSATSTTQACDMPSGYVSNATDCNDSAPGINPAATEICDSANVDEDCDGLSDNLDSSASSSGKSTFYADVDLDGYGNSASTSSACDASTGWVTNSTDCNDADATAYPGATESCDGVDDDCDGTADDGVETTFYADTDDDGRGNASSTESACEASTGYVSNSDDCDDTDETVYLNADELCDDQDNDCDSDVDEAAVDQTTWSRDRDGDGYGNPDAATFTSCDAPGGYVETSGDCDDTDEDVNPAATEVFNEYDDDCDDLIDENTSCITVIEILNDGGEATTISAIVSDDSTLDGEWYPGGVPGVSVVATSLGGDDWDYESTMDLCIGSSGYVIIHAEFEDSSSLCESMAATGLVYGTMDDIDLDAVAYDNLDGTCDTILTR